jgi:hypothetical protein
MLQLVPEVPVCPEDEIVRFCAIPEVINDERITQTMKKWAILSPFRKIFSINCLFNEL